MVSINIKSFRLKGSLFTLTILQLLDTDLSAFDIQLAQTVSEAPNFFRHTPIIIDLQSLPDPKTMQLADLEEIIALLNKHQLIPIGFRGGDKETQQLIRRTGLAVFPHQNMKEKQHNTTSKNSAKHTPPLENKVKSLLVTEQVRSGQQVYAKNCDLIVLSQVSQGAELLADGNIHIYGTLRGRALAGITGNTHARIFCQAMDAELISIAGYYIIADALKKYNNKPLQMFYLNNESLCAQAL